MKKKLLLTCFGFILLNSVRADFWTQLATCPSPGKELPIFFSIGNKGYVGCGASSYDFWEYDPGTNLWTQKADVGTAVRRAGVGFSINDKGYVCSGEVVLNDFWEYDTTANTWTQLPNFPGTGRSFAAAFVIGNKAYFGGGQSPTFLNDIWEWDQTTQVWTQLASCTNVMTHQVAFALLGKGYWTTSCCSSDEMWEYDPATNSWMQKATFPGGPRSDANGFVICDRGFLMTGGEGPYYNDLWEYNPLTNSWLQKADIPTAGRDDGAAFAINGKGYYGFGQIGGFTNVSDFWEYTPDTNCSTLLAAFTADNHICPGTCTDFTNLSINASSFVWNFPGANPSSSTDMNPVGICYSTPGTYDVSLIASNITGSDTLTLTNFITVYPYPPAQGITQSGDSLIAIQGAVSYQWYYAGSIITGATDYFYIASQWGDYNVVATDANGCEVEAVIYDVIASVSSPESMPEIRLYSNPSDAELAFSCTISGFPFHLKIYDVHGRLVHSSGEYTSGEKITLPVAELLSPGTYWLTAECRAQRLIKKVLIQK